MCISIHTDFHSAAQCLLFLAFSRSDTAQLCRKMQINKCRIAETEKLLLALLFFLHYQCTKVSFIDTA